MNFTKTPPTKPGAYWFRCHNGTVAAEVRVFREIITARLVDGGPPRGVAEFVGEWCGPLLPAEEVGTAKERDDWRACAAALNDALHDAVGDTGGGWETNEGEDAGPKINAAFDTFDRLTAQS
jgi:hypothetical protein